MLNHIYSRDCCHRRNWLKKFIALSPLSQLEVVISALALGLQKLALLHLITHALFKALLFIRAGSLIHTNNHFQDVRSAGHITLYMPLVRSAFLISNTALCGLPFLTRFYSKDLILEIRIYYPNNLFISQILILATILTATYTTRFILITWSSINDHTPCHSISDFYPSSYIPITAIALAAISGGSFLYWIFSLPYKEPFLILNNKYAPLTVTLLGLFIGWAISSNAKSISLKFIIELLSSTTIWFLTPLSSQAPLKLPLILSILSGDKDLWYLIAQPYPPH